MPTRRAVVALAACLPPTAMVSVIPEGSRINELFQKTEADVAWVVSCPEVAGFDCPAATGGTRTVFAAAPGFTIAASALGVDYKERTASDQRPLPGGDCWGCKVVASVSFACGRGLATVQTPAVSSAPEIIPPHIRMLDRSIGVFSYQLEGALADVGMPVSADAVPLEFPFRLNGFLFARPKGNEMVTLRMVGPGIDLTREYRDDPATGTSGEDSSDVLNAYLKDPESRVRASGPGTVRAWLEFEGVRSDEVTLDVVMGDADPGQ